jgi:hypothetical protein
MSATPQLNAAQPVVMSDGTMHQSFRRWASIVTDQLPITGIGSPEGVIDAPQFAVYLNTIGGPGAVQYRKMLPEIGGDTKKGWVLM